MEVVDNTVWIEDPSKKGLLKVKCKCGHSENISDEVIKDGLNWTMLIGSDHYLTLVCSKCGSELTMYIEEITSDDAISEESNKD